LVEELADTVPAFQDSALFTPPTAAAVPAAEGSSSSDSSCGSIKIVFLRKAQALAAELGLRFGREDARFAFEDAANLAADSGGFALLWCLT
jgi:hypothetical protein